MRMRSPAVASMFYSDKPQDLAAAVRSYVADAAPTVTAKAPKAIIAPHAGFIYSGDTAGPRNRVVGYGAFAVS